MNNKLDCAVIEIYVMNVQSNFNILQNTPETKLDLRNRTVGYCETNLDPPEIPWSLQSPNSLNLNQYTFRNMHIHPCFLNFHKNLEIQESILIQIQTTMKEFHYWVFSIKLTKRTKYIYVYFCNSNTSDKMINKN